MSSSCVWGLSLPLPPKTLIVSFQFLGKCYNIFSESLRISPRSPSARPTNATKLKFFQDLLTVNLRGGNVEDKDSSGLFTVFMQPTLGKSETPYLLWGGILLSLTIFTLQLSEPKPLDENRTEKAIACVICKAGLVIYRQLFLIDCLLTCERLKTQPVITAWAPFTHMGSILQQHCVFFTSSLTVSMESSLIMQFLYFSCVCWEAPVAFSILMCHPWPSFKWQRVKDSRKRIKDSHPEHTLRPFFVGSLWRKCIFNLSFMRKDK